MIDQIAPRYTALQKNEKVCVRIAGVSEQCDEAVLNPKVTFFICFAVSQLCSYYKHFVVTLRRHLSIGFMSKTSGVE